MTFTLRPWQMSDLDSLVHHANNANIACFLTNAFPHPYTIAHGQQFISRAIAASPQNIFAIAVNGEAIGSIGLHTQADIMCKNMELGYWLSETFWNKGIMSRAIVQTTMYAFAHFVLRLCVVANF